MNNKRKMKKKKKKIKNLDMGDNAKERTSLPKVTCGVSLVPTISNPIS
jgi:hypothetical protein